MIENKIYIGIDIGLSGGIVAIQNSKILHKHSMFITNTTKTKRDYDIQTIVSFFTEIKKKGDVVVAIEKNQIIPISGRLSIASSAKGYGLLVGIISALQIPYVIVPPKVWQKDIFVGLDKKDTKLASAEYCRRLFPEEDFTMTKRSTKIKDGVTDALCIAKYIERIH